MPQVGVFLREALRLCPPRTLRAPAWDLPLVLEAMSSPLFEPLTQVRLNWVSMKVAFLLAITSMMRVGSCMPYPWQIHACCGTLMAQVWSYGRMWPSCPRCFHAPILTNLSSCCFDSPSEEGKSELLCPVRVLKAYIAATASIRQSEHLFVCHSGPDRDCALSKQRLSHWIVNAITHAYGAGGCPPWPSGVRCHSTRSISTSWAALRGVPLETICAAAS